MKSVGRILTILCLSIFLINIATALEFDNIKYERDVTFDGKQVQGNNLLEKYKPIEIKNIFGLGKTLFEGYISQHTETCGQDCYSTIEINLHKDGVLVEDITFKTLQEDGSWIEQGIRSYQISYQGEIQDYKTNCIQEEELENGTTIKKCSQVEDGTHIGDVNYEVGEKVKAGIYTLKLEADKKPSKTIDWIITSQGKVLNEWAVWGNISQGDDAEVILHSPEDNYVSLTNEVQFNCSANITGGSTIVNMTLWTNESGVWEAKNTTNISMDNLISQYWLDGTSGVVVDSVGGNDAVNHGATRGVAGKINTAFDFDGATNFIDRANLSAGESQGSVSAWIKRETTNTHDAIVAFNEDDTGSASYIELVATDIGEIRFGSPGGGGLAIGFNTNEIVVDDTNWHHVVVLSSGIGYQIWVDGVNKDFTMTEGTNNGDWTAELSVYDHFCIGMVERLGQQYNPFDGKIDEVSIFNKSLSPSEITTLYNSGNAERSLTKYSLQTWNRTITDTTLWTCQAYDSDGDCGFATENRTLFLDATKPQIEIESPIGILDYGASGENETLNVTFTDTNLEYCWYDYNGTNVTIEGCQSGVKNSTNFILESGNTNMTIYANDSIGNENSTFIDWRYSILQNSINYTEETRSGASETLKINLTYDSSFSAIFVILQYNNTNYTMTTSDTGYTREYSYSLLAPQVEATHNITFNYLIGLSNTTDTYYYSSQDYNQSISPFLIDDCSAYSHELMNFTMVDEESLEEINGTIFLKIGIYSHGTKIPVATYNKLINYVVGTESKICLQDIGELYTMDYTIKYFGYIENASNSSSSDYFTKYKTIQKLDINSTTPLQNLKLYNLLKTSGNTFKVILTGNINTESGNTNLLVDTQKQYLAENEFYSVESSVSSSEGIATTHLIPSSEIYNFIVSDNGLILGTFNNYQVQCQNIMTGQCSITLNLARATGSLIDFENYGSISQIFLLDRDAHILYQTFTSTDGESHLVNSLVLKNDGYLDSIICNNTLSGTSGTIVCAIPIIYQETSFLVQTSVDGVYIGTKYFSQGVDIEWYGVDILIELLMLTSLVLLFISHPITIVVGAILGLIMPLLLLYVAGASLGVIMGALIFYIVAGSLIIWQIGKRM